MTVNDYILQKFQTFGVNLSEADLFDICLNAKISGGSEMNEDCQTRVSVAIAKFIPSLIRRQRQMCIRDRCKQYGLKDELGNKPKVTFL